MSARASKARANAMYGCGARDYFDAIVGSLAEINAARVIVLQPSAATP